MIIGNGWVLPAAVMLPNLLFFLFPPNEIPVSADQPKKAGSAMTALERIGQAGIVLIPFFYGLRFDSILQKAAAVFMALLLLSYYICWFRYFAGGRKFRLLFSSILGIPIPMAVFPVLLFFTASLNMMSIPLLAASTLLAIGHIYNSWKNWELVKTPPDIK